jgi:endoglucanase
MTLLSRLAGFGLTVLLLSAQSAAKIIYAGVNSGMPVLPSFRRFGELTECIAGGEFTTQNLPGAFGTDYQFINESAIDFFLDAGVNTIRVTFLLVH